MLGARQPHELLLRRRQARIADFDAEIAARDHDAVRRGDDLGGMVERFGAFELGDDAGLAAGGVDQSAAASMSSAVPEGHRDIVRAMGEGVDEVGAILGVRATGHRLGG